MRSGSICEPVKLGADGQAKVQRVATALSDPAPGRFPHFHDATEMLWFGAVAGRLVSEDGTFDLRDGTLAFIPPMRQHDFAIAPGAHRWVLVHVDALSLAASGERSGDRLRTCRVAHFDGAMRDRIASLFDWLVEASNDTAQRDIVARLIGLILVTIAKADDATPVARAGASAVDRLRPALDLIARNPQSRITLAEAASACNLSEAYFSRRFRQMFGSSFSDYLRGYRLRLAAQRLLAGGERISAIAYQTGFASPAHMTERFRQRYGVSPSDYRAAARSQQRHDSE